MVWQRETIKDGSGGKSLLPIWWPSVWCQQVSTEAPPAIFFSQNFCQNSEYFREFLPKFCVKFYPKKRVITTFATKKRVNATFATTKKQRNCNITRFATKKRIKPCPIEINVNNVTSIATVYWCINVDSTFVYLGPLDFNKDSNNHICCRQMLYKGLVIIITALFSDCKTFGKIFRISVKFCHWNPKNSEILSKLRNSELCGASGLQYVQQIQLKLTFGTSTMVLYCNKSDS